MLKRLKPRRHLNLEGTYNVRDIGGYATSSGRMTRWRALLRADSLHRLSPSSQAAVVDYGVRTVIDLRGSNEVQDAPSVFASSSEVTYYHQNMMGDSLIAESANAPNPPGRKGIVEFYTTILDRRGEQISETLATLATPGVLPALIHCTTGKDRTGLVAALVLGLAGVPAETIAEDYALSGRYLLRRYLTEQAPPEVAASGYSWKDYQREYTPPDAMLETLRYLEQGYGGIEAYVLDTGLTRGQIERLHYAITEWPTSRGNPSTQEEGSRA